MSVSKYERLLNKIKKNQSYINIATDSGEWSKETSSFFNNTLDLSVYNPEDTEDLKDEAKKMRWKMIEIRNKKMKMPKLYLSLSGEQSSLNKPDDIRTPLKFFDIHNLLTAAINKKQAPYKPEWCTLLRKAHIPRVILIIIDCIGTNELHFLGENKIAKTKKRKLDLLDSCSDSGLELEESHKKSKTSSTTDLKCSDDSFDLSKKWQSPLWFKHVLPNSAELFGIQIEVFAADQPIAQIFTTPISGAYLTKINQETQIYFTKAFAEMQNQPQHEALAMVKHFFTPDKFDRRDLLLSAATLIKRRYPINIVGGVGHGDPEFRNIHENYEKVTKTSPIFGVDCEMCLTQRGQELSMVSIVNEDSEVIYSTYVKPDVPIKNYLTEYSGVTKEKLHGVTTTLKHVQKVFETILPKDAILVGHSLHCDLTALKLFHPYVIDTALIFNLSGVRYICPSLKLCAKLFLNRIIQKSGTSGHDPTEDASASLQLAKLKLSRDINFGDCIKSSELPFSDEELQKTHKEVKSLKNAIPSHFWAKEFNRNMFTATTSDERSSSLLTIGKCGPTYESFLETSPSTKVSNDATNIKELFKRAEEEEFKTFFTVLHVKMSDKAVEKGDSSTENLKKQIKCLDKRIKNLHHELPTGSLIATVFTGTSRFGMYSDFQASNGIALIDVKDQEKKDFYSFRKL